MGIIIIAPPKNINYTNDIAIIEWHRKITGVDGQLILYLKPLSQ